MGQRMSFLDRLFRFNRIVERRYPACGRMVGAAGRRVHALEAGPRGPGANETYRVNGSAKISVDPALLGRFDVRGKPPRAVIVVSVEEAFNHCPKAFVRADLWARGGAGRAEEAPTHGAFAAYRDGADAAYATKYDADYAERIQDRLY